MSSESYFDTSRRLFANMSLTDYLNYGEWTNLNTGRSFILDIHKQRSKANTAAHDLKSTVAFHFDRNRNSLLSNRAR